MPMQKKNILGGDIDFLQSKESSVPNCFRTGGFTFPFIQDSGDQMLDDKIVFHVKKGAIFLLNKPVIRYIRNHWNCKSTRMQFRVRSVKSKSLKKKERTTVRHRCYNNQSHLLYLCKNKDLFESKRSETIVLFCSSVSSSSVDC